MIKRILILSLIITSGFFGLAADQVRFIGTAKQIVKVGERFRVVYEINQDGGSFRSPNFSSLQVLSGPSTSTNSSIQYVNGKMTKSYTMTYTYVVQATKEGDVVISPATVVVDREKVKSNSIKIKVVKGAGAQQGTNTQNSTKQSQEGVLHDDDVYIRATITNTKPYIGQQVILIYRIYTRVSVSNLMVKKLSSFQGFWSKSLMDDNRQYQQQTEIINGEEYTVAEISKFAIFPQKTGKLIIEPAEMECTVQLRVQSKRKRGDPFDQFFNDPFFNRNVKNINTLIKSNKIVVNVSPLPQQGKPEDFNGAVGDFRLSSRIDRTNLNANDALTLTFTISGKGNLELLNLPEVRFPTDFESFDPKISSNIKTNNAGISGKKKFEYLAIPRNGGDFEIKPISFSYFNPADKRYHTLSSEEYKIHVEKGDISSSNGISYSSSAQEDIRFIGKDIRHIKTLHASLKNRGEFLFLSNTFFIFLILPIIIMIILVIVISQFTKRRSDIGLMKNRKANKIAKNRLKSAKKYKDAGDEKAYYDEIAQALWGYIADKFSLKQSELSIETVVDALVDKNVEKVVTESFINTLNNIEFARFAPGDSSGKMETIYNESVVAILQAEKALK